MPIRVSLFGQVILPTRMRTRPPGSAFSGIGAGHDSRRDIHVSRRSVPAANLSRQSWHIDHYELVEHSSTTTTQPSWVLDRRSAAIPHPPLFSLASIDLRPVSIARGITKTLDERRGLRGRVVSFRRNMG